MTYATARRHNMRWGTVDLRTTEARLGRVHHISWWDLYETT